jgi:RimJ/RimL family protein N-acetyltransferase
MPDFIIREATSDDAEQILAHMERLVHEPNNGLTRTPADPLPTLDEERKLLAEWAVSDNSVCLVAVAGGHIIGVCSCRGGTRTALRHVAGIGISVSRHWRNKGVGTALMQRTVEWARRSGVVTRLELEVNTDNRRAFHVYRKVGFVEEGIKRHALFKEGRYLDNYFMALLLE